MPCPPTDPGFLCILSYLNVLSHLRDAKQKCSVKYVLSKCLLATGRAKKKLEMEIGCTTITRGELQLFLQLFLSSWTWLPSAKCSRYDLNPNCSRPDSSGQGPGFGIYSGTLSETASEPGMTSQLTRPTRRLGRLLVQIGLCTVQPSPVHGKTRLVSGYELRITYPVHLKCQHHLSTHMRCHSSFLVFTERWVEYVFWRLSATTVTLLPCLFNSTLTELDFEC